MKLLYSLTAYPPSLGGAQLHQHWLARALCERHSIQVVSQWDSNRSDWLLGTTIRAPGRDRDYVLDSVKVRQIGLSHADRMSLLPWVLLYYPLMSVALPRISSVLERRLDVYAERVDLVHNVRIGREGLSYASLQVARRHDIPFVLTPLHHPRWVGWRYRAYHELYQMADCVLALTEAEKTVLVAIGVHEERINVIGHGPILAPNGDADRFRQGYGVDGPIVLFLGQHYPYKGFQHVLQAAPLVWGKIPEVSFVFAGPAVGRSERLFAAISDNRVHRLGAIALQDKTDALAACTCLCVPSTQESFGGVYTEAWSLGKPVIGCETPAVAEVISDGVDGYLTPQDPKQIAERICSLLLDQGTSERMGQAGQRKVQDKYSWKKIAQRTERAYERTLGR